MRTELLTFALITLAACDRQPAAPYRNEDMAIAPTAALTEFPAEFQGRWGLMPADCEPNRSDAKGLMTIEARRVTFYESRANWNELTLTSSGTIMTIFTLEGEGRTWEAAETLTLLDGGNKLERVVTEPSGDFTYTKCPTA